MPATSHRHLLLLPQSLRLLLPRSLALLMMLACLWTGIWPSAAQASPRTLTPDADHAQPDPFPDDHVRASIRPPDARHAKSGVDPFPDDSAQPSVRPVDANHATVRELQTLRGVGPAMAERIIAARTERPFDSFEDFARCPEAPATMVGSRTDLAVRLLIRPGCHAPSDREGPRANTFTGCPGTSPGSDLRPEGAGERLACHPTAPAAPPHRHWSSRLKPSWVIRQSCPRIPAPAPCAGRAAPRALRAARMAAPVPHTARITQPAPIITQPVPIPFAPTPNWPAPMVKPRIPTAGPCAGCLLPEPVVHTHPVT